MLGHPSSFRLLIFQFDLEFCEIKDNIINQPLNNNIMLKLTMNYNYLRYTIYSNMIVLFEAFIIKIRKCMVFK